MYKYKLMMMSAALLGMTLFVGGRLATMQQTNTNNQTNQNNQNNSNGNRNSNGNSNNKNGNRNSMNSNSMNSNSMTNANSMMSSGMDASGMIGNMSMEEFMRVNADGAAKVAAVTASSAPLSKSDQKLMLEVAMGGMMQLEVSRAALGKVTSPEAKLLAQSEVEEQTGLSAKLKEIAAAKNVTLPSAPDAKIQAMVAKMQSMSGADYDRNYVRESGVKGHEKLDKTMSKVESKGSDDALKSLAAAAHPLVRTHLQVSRDVVAKMSGGGSSQGGSSNSNSNRGSGSSNSNSNSNR